MLNKSLISCYLLFSSVFLTAQDIKYFFKLLPAAYTEELSAKTRDSILDGKSYYPASNDSDEIVVYQLAVIDLEKNWLRIEMSFESGQRAFRTFELRSFKTKTAKSIIVFSDFSGVPHISWQNNLTVFSYSTVNKKMVKVSSPGLISKPGFKDFLKANTPDSIIKKFEGYFSINYELGYNSNNIILSLYGNIYLEEFHKWLAGDSIEFVWNGERFIKQKPTLSE